MKTETNSQTALVVYDDRFARVQMARETKFVKRSFHWGGSIQVEGNVVKTKFPGLVRTGSMLAGGGGPTRIRNHDEKRYPNQGFTCLGCPHLVIDDEYFSPHCAHPFYLEIWGCQQYVTGRDLSAPTDCPMLGKRSEQAQRHYRWHIKSHKIFWDYYHATKRNPYREGFTVYR